MSQPTVNVNIESASNRWFQIIGTLLLCGAIGMVAYALAQRGWIEIAATMVTMFLFQFTRMMIQNGLVVLPKTSFAEGDFEQTRGALQTAFYEYQVWQKRSPIWRLCAIAIVYTLFFMLCRWLISVGLIVFSNQWVAGAAAALLGALIIAPNLFADLFKNLKSEPKETTEGNNNV